MEKFLKIAIGINGRFELTREKVNDHKDKSEYRSKKNKKNKE